MERRVWAAILIASIGWGTGGVATRAAFDQGVPPMALVLYRSLIATIAVLSYMAFTRRSVPRDRLVWKIGLVMAVTNLAGPFILFTLAFQYASAGFVSLLAAMIPLATAVMAHFMLPDEPMLLRKVGGLVIALAGVAVLLASGDSGLDGDGRPLLAFALGAAAVVLIGYAGVYAKRYTGAYEPVELTGLQFAMGAVLLIGITAVFEGMTVRYTPEGWGLLLYMGLASSFLPFVLFYWLLRYVSATQASLIGYIVPLVAVVFGILLLDEQLQAGIAIGGALILAGVILTDRAEAGIKSRSRPATEAHPDSRSP
jgi:drug/metabolite transporter (DMT)-like permease